MLRWQHRFLSVGGTAFVAVGLLTSCISDQIVRPPPVEPGETEPEWVDLDVLHIGAPPTATRSCNRRGTTWRPGSRRRPCRRRR